MIPVRLSAEPATFNMKVRRPGQRWLATHPTGRPHSYWKAALGDLATAFNDLCAYAAMYVPLGVVEHYLSRDNPKRQENRQLAYEWSNYRFASEWLNSKKGTLDDTVLDPFQVGRDWFEITLPDLQLRVTDRCPRRFRTKAQFTIERLGLRDDERILRQRRKWMVEYETTGDTGVLERNAPLLAEAVKKQHPRNTGQVGR